MNVLAIDIGTHCGYCFNQGERLSAGTKHLASPKEIKAWHWTRQDRKLDLRPVRLYQFLMHTISENKPDVLIFEDVAFSTTTLATQMWASLRGALWLACDDANLLTECIPVATLKKFATGSGHAKKEQMAAAALKSGFELPKLDDNGIDAFWLWRWAQVNLSRAMYEPQDDSNSTTGNAPQRHPGTNRRYPNHSPASSELASRRVCK